MAYGMGSSHSSAKAKCIVCGKTTSDYLTIVQYKKDKSPDVTQLNTSLSIPVCVGEHYDSVAEKKEALINHAKLINKIAKA